MSGRSIGSDEGRAIDFEQGRVLVAKVIAGVERVFRGKREIVELALTALFARGHVLFEDVPGVGKTTLARAVARTLGLDYQRIQFTSDLLPADILGVSVFDPDTRKFELNKGPIFASVLLADEINRTTPRTQSALLEAMAEGSVTIDGATYRLPRPFFVMATQNPREFQGTYPLPESQLDRFISTTSIGYPDRDTERDLIRTRRASELPEDLVAVTDAKGVESLCDLAGRVHVSDPVLDYGHSLVEATRRSPYLSLGLSTRGALAFFAAAQARALVEGRDFVSPDDVRASLIPVAGHRVLPRTTAEGPESKRRAVETALCAVLESVPAPT